MTINAGLCKRGGDRRTPQERQAAQERAAQMAARRAQGWKLGAIGREFGVTRQRVHAILADWPPENSVLTPA